MDRIELKKRVNTPFWIGLSQPVDMRYGEEQQKDSGNSIKYGRFHRLPPEIKAAFSARGRIADFSFTNEG